MGNYRYDNLVADTCSESDAVDTLTQRVYSTLHNEIVTGVLVPGDRLVRRTLSKRLGVSPMPVTEALLRLEFDGLIENRPQYGCRVRPLSLEDIQNDEALREAIECQAARFCAEKASDDQLGKLLNQAKILDRIAHQGDPKSEFGMKAHLDFHFELTSLSGFPRLSEEIKRVWFRRYMRLKWLEGQLHDYGPEDWHQQLVKAIATRDVVKAEDKMREHVRYNQKHHLECLRYLVEEQQK